MKANELRIDNFVFDNSDITKPKQISQITDIEFERVSIIVSYFPYISYDKIEPIPLTEEWLIKFGFSLKEAFWYSIKTKKQWIRFEISLKEKRCILFNTKYFIFCDISFTRYVHQIQNLYFALTGNELTLQK